MPVALCYGLLYIMEIIKLDSRLLCVASLVRKGKTLLDVGTDHAYLPVYLLQKGICPSAVVCDINQGPLNNAKQTIENAELEKYITPVLSDGLKSVEENCAEDIAIAGMGGILISEILSCAEWVKQNGIHLILQPMTHSEDTRKLLIENGFEIDRELACSDSKHVYCVISAIYTGNVTAHEQGYIYYGELPNCKTDDAEKWLKKEYSSIRKKRDALQNAGKNLNEVEYLSAILKDFEKYTEVNYADS